MAKNQRLNATIQIGGAIAPTLKNAFGTINKSISGVGKNVTALESKQRLLGRSIRDLGRAGMNVDGLRNRYSQLTTELDRARRAQERLTAARKRTETIVGVGGTILRSVGAATVAAGLITRPLVGSAIERENAVNVIRNSGVSKEDAAAMVKAAQDSKQFGVSITRATETVSELRTALGDAHHAIEALPNTLKALSGLQLYNRGHKNQISEDAAYSLAKIAEERGGASSPEALREKQNWAFKALTGSNGVVTADDMLTAIRRGKSAVAAMNDRAFFGDTFLMQAMGANGYGTASSTLVNAWIGGHQTHGAFDEMMKLGLLNRGGVQFDKTGKVKKVSSSALIDNALFLSDPQAWVDKHLAPIAKSRGVDLEDPAQIAKFVNSIASNTNAANILMQRLRFSHNIAKDRHNVDIANGVDESDAANRASTQGKIDNARARLNDAQVRVGNVLLPAFATAMEKTASVLEALNRFADKSPTAFKAVTYGVVGLTTAVSGLAAAGLAKTAVTGLVGALGGGVGGLGSALAALANPIGIAVLALGTLAAAAYAFRPISQSEVDAVKDHGGAKLTPSAKARVDAGELDKPGALPSVPPMRGTTQNIMNDSRSYSINVTAAPGMDHNQIADTVVRKLDQRDGVRRRSSMFDGASQ
ncbi:hypothetical protein CFB40_12115 [Burkholderia sp. AU31652]|uniref:hypothetical protein n=1 Tax=Burkholderia sp. AU31652 TaxID=2015354 RepID=UPI000B7AAF5D|nr:hypothetical protein [Burkholderia sp. AU31652]OXI91043.1 hypothetical protein CFB40_12115 [Burkholderia sp. AU31652]